MNEKIRILVFHKDSKEKVQSKVERELLWYDHIKRKMLSFKGGRLAFAYKYDEEIGRNRMLPEVVDDISTQIINKKDLNAVNNWFNSYSNYNNTNASLIEKTNEGCIFEISEKEKDDFTYELERNSINYSVI